MENKKLFEILTLVEGITDTRWTTLRKIVDEMSIIEVLEKQWNDKHKRDYPEIYPLDLSDIKTWSTFDDCIKFVFKNENNKLICDVSIYDKIGYNEDRYIKLRFTATLILPDDFIKEIESSILYAFDYHAEDCYEKYLENQKKKWMENYKSQILGKNL